ncbi:MAG TPA: acyl-CoA dehydrogenase family protein, partial [Pseudomonadales bacterium]
MAVQFVLTEEQGLLRDQVRDLLQKQATPESLRTLITNGEPWNPNLWREMAGLGLLGAAIPESYGGVGLGAMELAVICEELGRAVAPVPFFSSVCMAAEALALAGSDAQKARWLPGIASGETVATFAWAEGNGGPGAPCAATIAGGRLRGRKWPVPDAGIADLCVVLARSDQGPALAVLELNQRGVTRTPLDGFDQLRHHADVAFDGARCEVLDGAPAAGALDELFDRLAVYEAFEQLGGTESALYMARDYTMQRYIFGRQLASYQAVKHNLADILVMAELARGNA